MRPTGRTMTKQPGSDNQTDEEWFTEEVEKANESPDYWLEVAEIHLGELIVAIRELGKIRDRETNKEEEK